MIYYFNTYADLICLASFVLGLCVILFGLSYCLSENNLYLDKTAGYECGSDPFSDARDPFDIKFYLVSILFIISDVELLFFLPWVFSQQYILSTGFSTMYYFFFILILGFLYEYKKKALDWSE